MAGPFAAHREEQVIRMQGTLGDFVVHIGEGGRADAAARLCRRQVWPAVGGVDDEVRFVEPTPDIGVWWRGGVTARLEARGGLGLSLEPARGVTRRDEPQRLAQLLDDWTAGRDLAASELQGRFCVVAWDAMRHRAQACVDAFRTCPLFWALTASGLWLASDLRLIVAAGAVPAGVSPAAVYQYLNFGYVPAPLTAIHGVQKLPAGHALGFDGQQVHMRAWWDARYPADLARLPEEARVAQLRERIVETVRDYRSGDADGWGAFLSGGTDSSSICGILAGASPQPVRSFSIGFEEEGYDELGYARIASDSFGLHAHEYRVTEQDAVDAVVRLAGIYDEPFANASAIPTFHCASLAARSGVGRLVAGDGGDEIFGGNERYRKDAIFEMFHRSPWPLRAMGHGLSWSLRGVDARWANRVKNFVRRGSLPNPDRFYTDDAFASEHFEDLLSADFRRHVAVDDALKVQQRLYAQPDADHALHRLMYLDLKMTIADNDVVKVVKASRLAGVDVAFPYLDCRLVDFTGRLPWSDKLRGKDKRYLFKRATHDILPEAIRRKPKQGFGLPISVWLRRGGRYRDLVHDIVLSPSANSRGLVDPAFVRRLIEHHEADAWDHAAEIHALLMLELWQRQQVDVHA